MTKELDLLLEEIEKEYQKEVVNSSIQNDIDLLELLNKFTAINYLLKDNIYLMEPKELLLILYAIDDDKNKYLENEDEPVTFKDLKELTDDLSFMYSEFLTSDDYFDTIKHLIEIAKESNMDSFEFDNHLTDALINLTTDKDEINNIKLLLAVNPSTFLKFCEVMGALNYINEQIARHNIEKEKNIKYKTIHHGIKAFDIDEIFNEIYKAQEKLCTDEKEKRREKKNKERKYKNSTDLIKVLQTSKGKIQISDKLYNSLENPNFRIKLIRIIEKNNLDKYKELEEFFIKEENKTILEKLFKQSIFDYNKLTNKEKMLLSTADIEEIEKILNIFNNKIYKEIKDYIPISLILLSSNKDMVSSINTLLSSRLINIDFVKDNPSIFYDENFITKEKGNNKVLKTNLDNLKNNKYDTYIISKTNPEVLLKDENELLETLNLVNKYGIKFNNSKNYNLLDNHKYIKYVDLLIENDLNDYIINNPDIIDNNIEIIINRLLLNKSIYGNNNNHKDIIKNGLSIIIDDEDISDYLINSTFKYLDKDLIEALNKDEYEEAELEELDNYKVNDNVYSIGGITISRHKVLRNYNKIKDLDKDKNDLLFNSIIFDSVLNDEELDTIKKAIYKDKIIKLV